MPKHKRPAGYVAPLKSRKDIIAFLLDHEDYQRSHNTSSPLAWNVKCYNADFSAEHLIEVYRTSGEYNTKEDRWLDYPEWRTPALAVYEEHKDNLWEWAVEQSCQQVTDGDTNRCLWKGDMLDVKYGFSGNSGGWLVMTRFEGTDMTRMDEDDFRDYLTELDYKTLRNLYELVVQNDHDFRREAVRQELEFQAAWAWIVNLCADVPQPDKTQTELPLGV